MTLQLLDGGGMAREIGRATIPSLASQPFRPGEMTTPVTLRLSSSARQRLSMSAGSVPAGLWVRIVIEAEHQLERAVSVAGIDRMVFRSRLHERTRTTGNAVGIEARALHAYAQQLRASTGPSLGNPRREVTVLVPDQMLVGWTTAARSAQLPLSDWACRLLDEAADGTTDWEASAAESGETLAEWVLLAALDAER